MSRLKDEKFSSLLVSNRDIKPENIIKPVGNKPLVLVDFGAGENKS
ncbi:hypothetical protein [Scytonema sp. HK-05]|nr:hypothetical protein [Scytonema sp. HK-05]